MCNAACNPSALSYPWSLCSGEEKAGGHASEHEDVKCNAINCWLEEYYRSSLYCYFHWINLLINTTISSSLLQLLSTEAQWKRKQSPENPSPLQTMLSSHPSFSASDSALLGWYCSILITSTVAKIIVECFRVLRCPFVHRCVFVVCYWLILNTRQKRIVCMIPPPRTVHH